MMVNLLKANANTLGVTADDVHFDKTLDRTLTQLEQNTAKVTAQAQRLPTNNNQLTVTVDVQNLAGHKLPSGLPSRRSWLHVLVMDNQQNVIFESGKPLADGRIEGNDAEDNDPLTYEYHWEVINSPDQVQIYEPIMHNFEGEVTYTLLRAYSYAKDNRLLPVGFDKGSAHDDCAVYGEAVGDPNFLGGSDQVTYNIDVTDAKGQLTVTVELLYQTLSVPFIEDLATTNTDLVSKFMGLYDPAANVPVVLDWVTLGHI